MEQDDQILVRRFVRQGDGQAFAVLMNRYASMVYSTCLRILRDEAQSADAVQETFFQFASHAGRITGSLGSWLHRVATRRAVDLVRQNVSRRRREESYALETEAGADKWSEIEPLVDEALEELPEDTRELLVRHFLEGHSTTHIAAAMRLSQPTVSRRIASGLEELRRNLRGRGIVAGVVPLQTILVHSQKLVPETLRHSLGKIALAKAASASAPTIVAGAKMAMAGAVLVIATGIAWFGLDQPAPAPITAPVQASSPPPAPAETASFAEPGPVALNLMIMGALNQSQAGTPAPVVRTLPLLVKPISPKAAVAEPANTNAPPELASKDKDPGKPNSAPVPTSNIEPPAETFSTAGVPSPPYAWPPDYRDYLHYQGLDPSFIFLNSESGFKQYRVIEKGLNRPYQPFNRAISARPAPRAGPWYSPGSDSRRR